MIVSSHTHGAPLVQHDDEIGGLDGGGSLGYDEYRRISRQLAEGLTESCIGGEVQRRGGVVQNEDLGVAHQCAGDGEALLLTAREVSSLLLHGGIQTAVLLTDEIRGLGGLQRVPEGIVRDVLHSEAEVGAHRALEQLGLLGDNADAGAEGGGVVAFHGEAEDGYGALGGLVEAGDEVDQGGLTRSRTADDTHGHASLGGEADPLQRGLAAALVGHGHVIKDHGGGVSGGGRSAVGGRGDGHTRRHSQHRADAVAAGHGLGDGEDGGGQLDQLHQDLTHVVHQRHHLALGDDTVVHRERAASDEEDHCQIDDDVGHGVHDGGEQTRLILQARLGAVGLREDLDLLVLLTEGADGTDTRQILSCNGGHAVQSVLYLLIEGYAAQHDTEDHDGQEGDRPYENERQPCVDRKGHDHGAKDDDGGAEQETEGDVHARLELVYVAGHAGDHGGGAHAVGLGVGEGLHVGEQLTAHPCGRAYGGAGGEILGGDGPRQTHEGQQHQHAAELPDEGGIISSDTLVDDGGHHQRHTEVEAGLQELEQGGEDAFLGVHPQAAQEDLHMQNTPVRQILF